MRVAAEYLRLSGTHKGAGLPIKRRWLLLDRRPLSPRHEFTLSALSLGLIRHDWGDRSMMYHIITAL